MVKDTNKQRSIVLPKEIDNLVKKDAQENFCSVSAIIKKIIIEHYKKEKSK